MTQQQILESNQTKTKKMQLLFELGLSRRQVANLMGVGYGFAQNVYAKTYPDRISRRAGRASASSIYTPTAFDRKFGIEIEFYGVDKSRLVNEINRLGVDCRTERYGHNTRDHWKIVSDSSIEGTRGQACEIVSPILRGEDGLRQLKLVCDALKTCRALINKTCGLHIHFDMSRKSINAWRGIYENYVLLEDVIDSMMPRSRRGNTNFYCRSLTNRNGSKQATIQAIKTATTIQKLSNVITGNSRYCKINAESYFRHTTIEFRQHSGTREFDKMKNWILFLHQLVDFSEQGFIISNHTFEGMSKFMQDEQHDFYHNRIQDLAA